MKPKNRWICLCFPLLGLIFLAGPGLMTAFTPIMNALWDLGLALWPLVKGLVWFAALATVAVLTVILMRGAYGQNRSSPAAVACSLVSALIAVILFWDAYPLMVLFAAGAAWGFNWMANDTRRGPEDALFLTLAFGLILLLNCVILEGETTKRLREQVSVAHTLSAGDLAALDAELRERYLGADAPERDIREWAMTDGPTAPATLSRETFPFGEADTLRIPLPDGRDVLRCAKRPDGRPFAVYPQVIPSDTDILLDRLCALRSAEY